MSKWLTEQEESDLSKKERKALKAERKESGITAKMAMKAAKDDADAAADTGDDGGDDGGDGDTHVKVAGDVWAGMLPKAVEGKKSDEADAVRGYANSILDLCQQMTNDMAGCLDTRQKAIAMRKLTTRIGQVGKDFRSATVEYKKK